MLSISQIEPATLQQAFRLIAVLIVANFFMGLYQSALVGLEKMPVVGLLRAGAATASAVGGVLLVAHFGKSVVALFTWQLCIAAVGTVLARIILERALPKAPQPARFSPGLVRQFARFAAGMTGIALVSTLVMQFDRWILVGLLSLKDLGHYAIAAAVANAVSLMVAPLFGALFPRLTSLVSAGDLTGTLRIYRTSTQILVATIVPIAVVLATFSYEALSAWTNNPAVSTEAAPILKILIFGSVLNGLMNIPYALHLAYGNTRPILLINLAGLAFLVPAVLLLTPIYGPAGAAVGWLGFNILFCCLAVPLTHAKFSQYSALQWLLRDVLLGSAAALIVTFAAKYAEPLELSRVATVLYLGVVLALSGFAAALCGSETRRWLLHHALPLGRVAR
jgi:O-antigen/teichoic acid export membrane protein